MSAKHTAGPWVVGTRVNCMIDVMHNNNTKGAITKALCRVQARDSWVEEAHANARLIAAAPDLLASLIPFVALLQDHNCTGPDSRPIFGINDAIITLGDLRAARSAIVKAEGKS